jgi:hypothetical protein
MLIKSLTEESGGQGWLLLMPERSIEKFIANIIDYDVD